MGIEGGAKVRLMCGGQAREFFEGLSAGPGEGERIGAAVTGFATAGHETPGLQFIDQNNHAAGEDAEPFSEFLLTAVGYGIDHAQQARVGRRQSERGDAPAEALGGVRAQLGEQEGRATRPANMVRRSHARKHNRQTKKTVAFKYDS